MNSKTKINISDKEVEKLLEKSGFAVRGKPEPMTEGEFNAIFSAETDKGDVVIKLSPNDESALLTYEKGIMKREIELYNLIGEKTGIPVPKVLYNDFSRKDIDCDFFIMEKISGETLDKTTLTPDEKRDATVKIFSQLHEIFGTGYGYNSEYKSWYEALHAMTNDLVTDGEKKLISVGACRNLLKRELKLGEKLLVLIDKNRPILENVKPTLVNFDLWEKNMILSGEKIYMIDPERAFYGDFIGDFIATDMMKLKLSHKTGAVRKYNELTGKNVKINSETEIRFLLLYGYLCFLMAVEKYYRYSPLNKGFIRNSAMDLQLMRVLSEIEKYGKE